jgi:hypothetical protein
MEPPAFATTEGVPMSAYIVCAKCPGKVYAPHQIDAYVDDNGPVTTLASLQPASTGTKRRSRKRFLRALVDGPGGRSGSPMLSETNFERLRDYRFRCPEGHLVDGNQGIPFGLAVLGPSSSSKSHLLPALVHELDDDSALRSLGVTLSNALYQDPQLKADLVQVYDKRNILEATTEAADVIGPYGRKLRIGRTSGDPYATEHSLLLYDVAGEKLTTIIDIVQSASFAIIAKALLVLIDPVDFLPTQFDGAAVLSERTRTTAAIAVRDGVRVIADTLSEVWSVRSSKFVPVPICFILAKADAIEWTGDFDWTTQTDLVLNAASDGIDLTTALCTSSDATRKAFLDLGGERVVQEIEDSFDADRVRFAAASATCAMPVENAEHGESSWTEDPKPKGVALSVLHVLNLAGLVPQKDADEDDGETPNPPLDSA